MIGSGIFMWCGSERRSGRYGTFYLSPSNYDETARVEPRLDIERLRNMEGQRVRVTCQVIDSRPSGHVGDKAWKVTPTQPELGEVIEVGVGTLEVHPAGFADNVLGVEIGLRPSEPREYLWLDPLVLYRLHDQTVELSVEPTDSPDSAPSKLLENGVPTPGCFTTGEEGAFQVFGSGYSEGVRFEPRITNLGDGLFELRPPHVPQRAGERIQGAKPLGGE